MNHHQCDSDSVKGKQREIFVGFHKKSGGVYVLEKIVSINRKIYSPTHGTRLLGKKRTAHHKNMSECHNLI